jgi:hypothetical protein
MLYVSVWMRADYLSSVWRRQIITNPLFAVLKEESFPGSAGKGDLIERNQWKSSQFIT